MAPSDERAAGRRWAGVVALSWTVRFVGPLAALLALGLRDPQRVQPAHPGDFPWWWSGLALAAAYDAASAYGPLVLLLRAFKERRYLRIWRTAADFGVAALAWGVAAAVLARFPASGVAAILAAGVAAGLSLGLGVAFTVYAVAGVAGPARSLRVREHHPRDPRGFVRPAGLEHDVRLAHLSDLHLTAGPDVASVSGEPGGNAAFGRLLRSQAGTLRAQDAVVVTGDVADAGRAAEWGVFFAAWKRQRLTARTVLVPGNHDTNIIDPGDYAAMDPAHVLRGKRLVRTLAALDTVQGERAWVWGPDGPLLLREHLHGHAGALRDFFDHPSLGSPGRTLLRCGVYLFTGVWPVGSPTERSRLASVERAWDGSFPMVARVPGVAADFVVLNSTVASVGLLDNALGGLDPGQLGRLEALLRAPAFRDRPKVFLLHHHVALPEFHWDFRRDLQAELMALSRPTDLLRRLPPGSQVVLHGHKHLSYVGRPTTPEFGRITVVSGPSSTLKDERSPGRPIGFFTLTVAAGSGQTALAAPPQFHPLAERAAPFVTSGKSRPNP